MDMNMKAAATKTAEKLDVIDPGWHSRINKGSLNMILAKYCPIGQLRGNYFTADLHDLGYKPLETEETHPTYELNARLNWGHENGLQADPNQCEYLKSIWLDLIDQRLAA